MSTFKVGDRVRIVRCFFLPELSGKETVITDPPSWYLSPISGRLVYGYGVAIHPNFWPPAENLEPLTNPGLGAEEERFVKDLQGSLSDLVKPGEIVEHGDVESAHA